MDHLVVIAPDKSLRTCAPRPPKPNLSGPDADKAEATLVVQLDRRGEDCASKLGATWQSIDQANERAAAANAASQPPK